jgi:protein phosphatase
VKGSDDGYVTIYRGVNGNVFGFKLYEAYERTTLKVSDLNSTGQSTVEKGVDKGSLSNAETWVRGLTGYAKAAQ